MSLSSRSRLSLVLPALALAFATACTTGALPSNSPAPTRSPSPTRTPHEVNVPTSLQGTWHANIQRSQVSAGLWTMVITNNEITVKNPAPGAEFFPVGLTGITADHMTFYVDQECQAGDDLKEGEYTYAVVADQLTFTLIQDLCRDRRALLTASPWDRQP